jgi:PPP family 3-phenylpropionic acid transporter
MPLFAASPAVRLAFYYIAYFLCAGIHLPYWPVWLAGEGMGPAAIGFLAGIAASVRIVAGPLAGWLADRTGERKRIMVVIGFLCFFTFCFYLVADGFWQIAAVGILYGLFWTPLMALGDSITVTAARNHGFQFGRVRMWGSVAFIVASFGGGLILAGRSHEWVLWVLIVVMGLQALSNVFLPDERVPLAPREGGSPLRRLLRDPLFILFMACASCAQISHTVLYAFGTLHWRAMGISDMAIGLLWAEGVVAEIILFYVGARLLRRVRPLSLFTLGLAAGVLRWGGTAFATEVWQLAILQALHGLSFGATYLGATLFVARGVAPHAAATAQSLYAAVSAGLALSIGFNLSGPLYATLDQYAFLVMMVVAGIGAAGAWVLRAKWGDRVLG